MNEAFKVYVLCRRFWPICEDGEYDIIFELYDILSPFSRAPKFHIETLNCLRGLYSDCFSK